MKCFPDTAEEYWLLSDALGRGAIELTPAGESHVQRRYRELGHETLYKVWQRDYALYKALPENDWLDYV